MKITMQITGIDSQVAKIYELPPSPAPTLGSNVADRLEDMAIMAKRDGQGPLATLSMLAVFGGLAYGGFKSSERLSDSAINRLMSPALKAAASICTMVSVCEAATTAGFVINKVRRNSSKYNPK